MSGTLPKQLLQGKSVEPQILWDKDSTKYNVTWLRQTLMLSGMISGLVQQFHTCDQPISNQS